MSEFGRRFDPSELADGEDGGAGEAAAAELLAVARDLEAFARSESVTPSVDFEDRVMAALADEPPPRPIGARGALGLVALVRDAWRLAWTGGRPLAVRAQALAFVLLAAVAVASVGAVATVGVGRLLSEAAPPPSVAPTPLPTPTPTMLPSPSPSASPAPSPTPTASPTEPTAEPTETGEPTATDGTTGGDSSGPGSGTQRPSEDNSGPGGGGGGGSSGPGSGSDSSGSGSGSGG
jgi:uncharacterized membrane protein YgcG